MISFLPFNTCWCLLKDYKYLNKYVYKIYFSTYLSRYDFLADTRRDQNSSKQQDQTPFPRIIYFYSFGTILSDAPSAETIQQSFP